MQRNVKPEKASSASDKPSPAKQSRTPPPPRFQLLIDCRSEDEQQTLYEQFHKDGLRCRVLVTA